MARYFSMFQKLLTSVLLVLSLAQTTLAQDGQKAYTLDRLNVGLTPAPEIIARDTPRATMESLLFLAERDRWNEAAHLLNLNGIDPSDQTRRGAELARMLETVIARKTVIPWDQLLDRPDALDAGASNSSAVAGQARRSILLWELDLDRYPVAIRLNRVSVGESDPVWVFSRQTVDNIIPLYDRYGPSQFERALPAELRENRIWGLMIWEIAALPVLIAIAILAGLGTRRALSGLSSRIKMPVASHILRAIHGPAMFGVITAILWAASRWVFVFSGSIDTILTPLIWIGLLGSLLWVSVNAIDVILDRLIDFDDPELTNSHEQDYRVTATRVAAGRRALIVVFMLVGATLFVTSTNLFDNLGLSLIGTAGALTLILGFAARRVLGNIMSSLQIALNGSAKIGDRLVYKDTLCHVERINFTFVQLRDWDGTRLIVPVEEFASTEFENWTLQEPEMLRIIKLKLAHDVDIDALRGVFDRVIDMLDQDELDDRDKAKVRLADQDVFGTEVWFYVPCRIPIRPGIWPATRARRC